MSLTRKPRKGDVVEWRGKAQAYRMTVETIDGNIARGKLDSECFIWNFQEGLNQTATIVEEGPVEVDPTKETA